MSFTTQGGRAVIRSFVDSSIITHMAVGIGNTAFSVADTRLECEVIRVPIVTITPDYVGGTVIYKATIPAEVAIDAYEIGLVNNATPTMSLLSDFTETTIWSAGTNVATNARVGGSTLFLNPALSTTTTAAASFSTAWPDTDEVVVSYFVGTNVASAIIRFKTDASNFYSYSLPVTAGYRITRIPRATFIATGTPSDISSVEVTATATAGGAGSVYYDSIIVNDLVDREPELQVRRVLAANITKTAGVARDIEYIATVTAT